MLLYCLKRIGLALVIIFFAMLVLFSLIHLIPGDPVSIALGPRATAEIQAKYAEKKGGQSEVTEEDAHVMLNFTRTL